ncbi:DoxX family protein [Roseateles violae]|uniref:DoxX family protein n=1 Tax=Roseateles violae TaxID=3058042 RepID=A0ABT8DT16_9BURK|nr:DoxX family protein [Pelomonas sp. PFR6]MDN3920059.1 DoxX family protein [Pelomonas sp. PFR6]
MSVETQAIAPSMLWAGRVISGLVIAFLLLDAGMKLVPLRPVLDAMQSLGFSGGDSLARAMGLLLLACTLLYALPGTAPLGALLLTGYLGGAIAVQLRAGNPWFSHVLFGAYVGIALWAGLLLRSSPLRALLFPSIP